MTTTQLDWPHVVLATVLLAGASVMGYEKVITGGNVFAVFVAVGVVLGVSIGVSGAARLFTVGHKAGLGERLTTPADFRAAVDSILAEHEAEYARHAEAVAPIPPGP